MWPPMLKLLEVLRDPLREQDVTGVAAIHHPLRHVDAGASHIGAAVYIDHPVDRAAVHAHAQAQV